MHTYIHNIHMHICLYMYVCLLCICMYVCIDICYICTYDVYICICQDISKMQHRNSLEKNINSNCLTVKLRL